MFVGMLLVGTAAILAVFGSSLVEDAWQQWKEGQPAKPIEPSPPRPNAERKPLTAAEKQAAKRQAFVDMRRPLQESVLDADGETVVHDFDESGIGQIEIPHAEAKYTVPISKNNGIQVWVYNTDPSIRRLSLVGAAEHHEVIDVTQLRATDRDMSLTIGECAVLETADGNIIQLLLVDAHVRMNGDEIDDARFKFRVYAPGTSQIRALRNGER